MVKARIGKTEIEGTPEEVAYILNGLLASQDDGDSVEVIHEAAPETVRKIARYKTMGEAVGLAKRKKRKGFRKTKYGRYLKTSLRAWVRKNYDTPQGFKTSGIVKALRAAGVPYSMPRAKLMHNIKSIKSACRQADKEAVKEEIDEADSA